VKLGARRTKGLTGLGVLKMISAMLVASTALVFVTLGYSAYRDFSSLRAGGSVVVVSLVQSGDTAHGSLNLTVANPGLYALVVSFSCDPGQGSYLSCNQASVSVPPGGEQTLRFVLDVKSVSALQAAGGRINGTMGVEIEPLLTLGIGYSLDARGGDP
jgi:hypothetical protein